MTRMSLAVLVVLGFSGCAVNREAVYFPAPRLDFPRFQDSDCPKKQGIKRSEGFELDGESTKRILVETLVQGAIQAGIECAFEQDHAKRREDVEAVVKSSSALATHMILEKMLR